MAEMKIVLTSIGSEAEGRELAQHLVREGLAACVNLLPGCVSVYEWQGKLEEESECLLVVKTISARLEELVRELESRHPYELPERVCLDAEAGAQYLQWVRDQCGVG